jgi:hypothetical protein
MNNEKEEDQDFFFSYDFNSSIGEHLLAIQIVERQREGEDARWVAIVAVSADGTGGGGTQIRRQWKPCGHLPLYSAYRKINFQERHLLADQWTAGFGRDDHLQPSPSLQERHRYAEFRKVHKPSLEILFLLRCFFEFSNLSTLWDVYLLGWRNASFQWYHTILNNIFEEFIKWNY